MDFGEVVTPKTTSCEAGQERRLLLLVRLVEEVTRTLCVSTEIVCREFHVGNGQLF